MGTRSLKEAVAPILWLNCIFFMGIFEIPVNRPRYYLSAFYAILMSIAYCVMFVKGFYVAQKEFTYEFSYEFITFYFVLGVNILVAVLAIILFWYKSKCINIIIKRSNLVDNTLEVLGIKKDYRRTFRFVLFLIILWIAGMALLNAMHVIWIYNNAGFLHSVYTDVSFCFPIMLNSVVDLTFASLIRCVQVKFQNINILISNIIFCSNENECPVFKIHQYRLSKHITLINAKYKDHKDQTLHLIQTLRQLHLESTRIARKVNHAFCFQLLLEMGVHFVVITATSYSIYGTFSNMHVGINSDKIIAMAIWGSVYSAKIILINYLCTCVSAESYKTGEIIQSFEGSVIDYDIREEIHQFTQQIILNSLNFTAAGFVTINNTLTGKFFATVTTYVVILIQMNPL